MAVHKTRWLVATGTAIGCAVGVSFGGWLGSDHARKVVHDKASASTAEDVSPELQSPEGVPIAPIAAALANAPSQLRLVAAASTPSATEAVVADSGSAMTNESRVALEEVDDLLTGASERGEWGKSEVEQFRGLTRGLPGEARAEAVRRLAVAINEHRFRITVHGFPM